MAYYLMVEIKGKGRSIYEAIDISDSPCFTRFSIHKGNMYELQELDYFTMMFNNRKELLTHLVKNGFIDMKTSRKPISIRRKSNDDFIRVPYDFLYQDSLEYIVEPKRVIQEIENKLYQEDYEYLADLANCYVKDRLCGSTAFEVRNYASSGVKNRNSYSIRYLYDRDENRDMLVTRLIKLIIYKHIQCRNGNILYQKDKTGKLVIDYRRLHDLVACMIHLEKNKKKKVNSDLLESQNTSEYSECEYDESIFDIVKNENNMEASIQDDTGLITYEVQKIPNVEETNKEIDVIKKSVHNTEQDCEYTVKKRTLKKDNYIDGQLSMF